MLVWLPEHGHESSNFYGSFFGHAWPLIDHTTIDILPHDGPVPGLGA